jgi:hypothetical protein
VLLGPMQRPAKPIGKSSACITCCPMKIGVITMSILKFWMKTANGLTAQPLDRLDLGGPETRRTGESGSGG